MRSVTTIPNRFPNKNICRSFYRLLKNVNQSWETALTFCLRAASER